jgi:hypothetical protein
MNSQLSPAILGLFIPIIGIVLGVAVAIIYIVSAHRQRMQRNELRHKERLAAIEKGLEIPVDAVEPAPLPMRRPRYLLRGLVLTFVGVALTVALRNAGGEEGSMFGLVLSAAGLAYLIFYFVEGRHEHKPVAGGSQLDQPPDQPPPQ